MQGAVFVSVAAVFVIDVVLMVSILTWKPIHRRRAASLQVRRDTYIAILSRYLAASPRGKHSVPAGPSHRLEPITERMAADQAFLDAIIDLRNIVTGPEVEVLGVIATRFGLVERQTKALQRRYPIGRRLRASVALAEMGDESSAQTLLTYLDDREPEIRIQCARGLGRMNYLAAIEPITARFDKEDPWVSARFADTLVGFGSDATAPLLAYVRANHASEDTDGVVQALTVLGTIGDHYSGPALTSILEDAQDIEVKLAAVHALGRIGVPLVLGSLLDVFDSEDWRLRAKTATALGDIGDQTVIPDLSNRLGDSNWWVRRNTAAALARIPGGTDALYEALDSNDKFARDAAAEALFDAGGVGKAIRHEALGTASQADLRLLGHMRDEALTA
jgi:HEAT repeat protein